MLIAGILLNVVGLGVLCWALFTLAVHALPFFVGMIAGLYAYQNGIGPSGAIVLGFAAGSLTLVVGQYTFFVARSLVIRLVIGLLFALPAARAGYDATLGLAHIGVPSGWWGESFGILGAIIIGCTAWARVSILTGPAPGGGRYSEPGPVTDWGQGPKAGEVMGPSSTGWDQRGDPAVTMTAISRSPAHFD